MNKKILVELIKLNMISGQGITKEEYDTLLNTEQDMYHVYSFKRSYADGRIEVFYEKFLSEDLADKNVELMLKLSESINTKVIAENHTKMEKYMHFWYILSIIGLILGILGSLLSFFISIS